MSVSGIEAIGGFQPLAAPKVDTLDAGSGTAPAGGSQDFGHLVLDGIDRLQAVQGHSDQLAVQAATGDLTAIHQYTIAASEAAVTTQLTVAVRNKALEAFNEIMRMPV